MPPRTQRSGVTLGAATTGNTTAPRAKSAPRIGGLTDLGAAGYLWLLVLTEVGAIALLRHVFRDHHGG